MVGGLAEWMENPPLGQDETADAWWRIYPRGFPNVLIPEMAGGACHTMWKSEHEW